MNNKQLDSYSMLICSKYFETSNDFINLICVNSKFKETTEKLRFNPIPIKSMKLFPKIQTQYFYTKEDKKIEGINNYEILYEIDYDQYLCFEENNIKCHNVIYTNDNRIEYGNSIPDEVTSLPGDCYSKIISFFFDDEMDNFNNITIPNNVTYIGESCFASLNNLKNCVLSTKLKTISNYCFSECKELATINLPPSVQVIGESCFQRCSKLQEISIPNSVHLVGFSCFNYCTTLQSITIPTSISILQGIFQNCLSLSKVILPTSIVSINDYCFENCKSLTSITLPNSLKNLGKGCFKNCGIESIQLPNSIKQIGVNCFYKTNSLIPFRLESNTNQFIFKVSYNDSILYKRYGITCTNIIFTKEDSIELVNKIIEENGNPNTLTIPTNVVEINNKSFYCDINLKAIIIPTTVTLIGDNVFENCYSLTSLKIPKSVKSIGINCFLKCTSLKELSLPLNGNNKYPFKVSHNDYLIIKKFNIKCENIVFNNRACNVQMPTQIPIIVDIGSKTIHSTIPCNIISMKSNYLSEYITSITIPTSVTYLCDECFKNYTNLQSIAIPTTVKYIGKHLIDGCISLTELKFDGDWNNIIVSYNDYLRYKSIGLLFNSIEYTNDDKIKYNDKLPFNIHRVHYSYYNRLSEMVYIPTYITSLDNHMFSTYKNNFSYLKSIKIPTSINTIPKYCFSECYLLTSVDLQSNIISIKKKAFSNCISLQSIIIPSVVEEIEQQTFENCYSLTLVIIPNPLPTLGNKCFEGCYQLKGILNIPDYFF